MKQIPYIYKNCPIPGGGYVTGFLTNQKQKDLLYIRTDIGGSYRFDADKQCWKSLSDHVTQKEREETYPIALATADKHPERLYIISGLARQDTGKVSVSRDFGETFETGGFPARVHGNYPGRGSGYRLIVDRREEEHLLFASQMDGLWESFDEGKTWRKNTAMPEDYLTLVGQVEDTDIFFVGTAGVTTKESEKRCGHSMYVSYDGGLHFEKLWQPDYSGPEDLYLAGLVAQRYAVDGRYIYVTFSCRCEPGYMPDLGYSCDAGKVTDGHVVRYPILRGESVTLGQGEEIAPGAPAFLHLGFGGIDVCPRVPGLVICSTIRKSKGESIYRSLDYGTTWTEILHDLDVGKVVLRTAYMKPEYNSNHSMVHWISDFKINPFDANEGWFNTGSGVFRTNNLLADRVEFTDWCDGLEETVHLNVYAPPKGRVKLIDILGDLGGFAFTDLDKPCENSFADGDGNRYVTCINADFSDEDPNLVVVTPRGNWTGMTLGGLILSKDQCGTFTRLPMPFGISEKLDMLLHKIETPNVNSGWVSMSPDGQNIVWNVAMGIRLFADTTIVSHDQGEHFSLVAVYDSEGNRKEEIGFKVFSDRMDSTVFYGFGEHSDFYVSTDCGDTFHQVKLEGMDEDILFTLIDCPNRTEVRFETGKTGVAYFAAGEKGLWKLIYSKEANRATVRRLSPKGNVFSHLGLGLLSKDSDYYKDNKALYVSGEIRGEYGFFRSFDDGESFERINNEKQMFGDINSIDGDCRVFGRFFIGTGSRGVLYGQEAE